MQVREYILYIYQVDKNMTPNEFHCSLPNVSNCLLTLFAYLYMVISQRCVYSLFCSPKVAKTQFMLLMTVHCKHITEHSQA